MIRFFVRSEEPFNLLGFVPWNVRLFGLEDPSVALFLFGSDRLGRDVFSRIFYAGRISLFIGFGGVFVAFILGVIRVQAAQQLFVDRDLDGSGCHVDIIHQRRPHDAPASTHAGA